MLPWGYIIFVSKVLAQAYNPIEQKTLKAIAGNTNETGGTRKYENITIKNCIIGMNGGFGEPYDSYFGAVTGVLYISNSDVYFNNCTIENCTVLGESSEVLFGGPADNNRIYVDNVKQEAPSTEELA